MAEKIVIAALEEIVTTYVEQDIEITRGSSTRARVTFIGDPQP